ncbi:MAG: urease accessory protein UreF [Rhodobacter sp.]|nr:urease accessory protein UreF [Rhodobacter sp.]
MTTDPDILTLAQWLSPAYPLGAFSYSHGLEWAVAAGDVDDTGSLERWLGDVMCHGSGRSDALFLAAAYLADTPGDLTRIDQTCRAFAASAERLRESDLQGAAFCEITARVWGFDLARLTFPVGVGRAARLGALPLDLTSQMYLQAFITNLVTCAQRLLPIGQTEAQALIHALSGAARDIAAQTLTGDLDMLSGTAFLADIASMKHETQYSRTFRT